MRIGEHGMREHLRLLLPAFIIVTGIWVLRLIVAASGIPFWMTRMVSVSLATTLSILLSVILIHVRRFGSYPSVVVASLLINASAQILIALAIFYSVLTGADNIYTVPEFSMTRNQMIHIYGHLTFGIAIGTFVGAAVGSFFLWLLRMLARPTPTRSRG
jgi:hypothetical protein